MPEESVPNNPNKEKKANVVKQLAKEAQQIEQEQSKGGDRISNLGELRATAKKFKLADVVVPILSIVLLALISIFVYMPMINTAIESNDETTEVKGKIVALEKLDGQLDQLNVANLQEDLNNAREVIPYSLQVSDFVYYIDNLAKEKNLIFKDIFAGDVEVKGGGIADNSVIKGVNGPLRYIGSLSDITEFLDELQNTSPFIVSTDQVEIKNLADSEDWEVSVTLTGYYVNKDSIGEANIYNAFFAYSKYTEAIQVFTEKAGIIDSEED